MKNNNTLILIFTIFIGIIGIIVWSISKSDQVENPILNTSEDIKIQEIEKESLKKVDVFTNLKGKIKFTNCLVDTDNCINKGMDEDGKRIWLELDLATNKVTVANSGFHNIFAYYGSSSFELVKNFDGLKNTEEGYAISSYVQSSDRAKLLILIGKHDESKEPCGIGACGTPIVPDTEVGYLCDMITKKCKNDNTLLDAYNLLANEGIFKRTAPYLLNESFIDSWDAKSNLMSAGNRGYLIDINKDKVIKIPTYKQIVSKYTNSGTGISSSNYPGIIFPETQLDVFAFFLQGYKTIKIYKYDKSVGDIYVYKTITLPDEIKIEEINRHAIIIDNIVKIPSKNTLVYIDFEKETSEIKSDYSKFSTDFNYKNYYLSEDEQYLYFFPDTENRPTTLLVGHIPSGEVKTVFRAKDFEYLSIVSE